MLSPIKVKTPKTPKTNKSENKKENKKTSKKEECLDEAETEASGVELKSKIQTKILDKLFKSQITDTNKPELFDLDTSEPWYVAKITIKSRDSQTSDEN